MHQAARIRGLDICAEISKESARLPEREKRLVLGIVRQFSEQLAAGER
jgi:hypothetical protein